MANEAKASTDLEIPDKTDEVKQPGMGDEHGDLVQPDPADIPVAEDNPDGQLQDETSK